MELRFYKKGQGYYVRMGTALAGTIMAGLGCLALYGKLDGISTMGSVSVSMKAWIRAGVPVLLFGAIFFFIFKMLNMPRFADFLISTEGEMKKVSWSSRQEIIASTKVVVVTVIIVSVLLALVDVGFARFFQWIGVLKMMPK